MNDFNPREVDEVLDQAIPLPSEKLAPGSEAPASATVHVWDTDNFGVLFTIRDTNAKNLYVRMQGLIQTLKNDGWKPDWKTEGSSTPPTTQKAVVGQYTGSQADENTGSRVCPKHNKAMTLGKYGWYCQTKDDSAPKGWCTYKIK